MTPFFAVQWSHQATNDWMQLAFDDAEAVARAVKRYGDTAEGLVIHIDGEFRLFVAAHVIAFLIEGDVLHVDRVYRA
jgi:hypothetical protein